MIRLFAIAISVICLSCGGSTSALQQNAESEEIGKFQGIESLERGQNNDWVVSWTGVSATVIYSVFRAKKGESFDFTKPDNSDTNTSYIFKPKNIFEAVPTCFVVRITSSAADTNTNSKCTDDVPFEFAGINGITRNAEGFYSIAWPEVPVDGVLFSIFESVDGSEYDFESPTEDGITNNFFDFKHLVRRGVVECYVVRYNHPDLPDDINEAEACTDDEEPIEFDGIVSADPQSATSVLITWAKGASKSIVGYRIYQGSDFKEVVESIPATATSFSVENLETNRAYSFVVRAFDEYGRTDDNIRSLSAIPN